MADVTVGTPGGRMDAYLATPLGAGPWPGVVVVHDAFGMGDTVRGHADRLATAGYLALAPDLYFWGPKRQCLVTTMRSLTAREGRAFVEIDAARGWLAEQASCSGRVGVIGFCMGGGFALLCAARGTFAAAAPSYGTVPKEAEAVLAGACPVVGSYGAKDRGLRGHAARLESTLTRLDVPHDVKEYPEAGHGFMDRHNVGPFVYLLRVAGLGYHHASAEDAWRRILTFFGDHLHDPGQGPPAGS
ncbi:MAG: dienelactone hydrolase family protein [Acidimicrobiales bacterium]